MDKFYVEYINSKREWWVIRNDGLVVAYHKKRANAYKDCTKRNADNTKSDVSFGAPAGYVTGKFT